jgi:hypothetical protein
MQPKRLSIEKAVIASKDQAQAMADFLWNEKQRHLDDIERIDQDLHKLEKIWGVLPSWKREWFEV